MDIRRFFKTRYRIIPDQYAGYEAQVKHWFWPFWTQLGESYGLINTSPTIEKAKAVIERHKNLPPKVLWEGY